MTNSVSYFIQGVIRVHLLEAENLVQKDNFLGAIRGKSDPYALLRVGTVQYRSKTVSRDLNPIWNETFEVLNLLIFPPVGYTAIYIPVLAGPSLSWLHRASGLPCFLVEAFVSPNQVQIYIVNLKCHSGWSDLHVWVFGGGAKHCFKYQSMHQPVQLQAALALIPLCLLGIPVWGV